MSLDAVVVNLAVALVLIAGFVRNWCVSRAKLRATYWMMIIGGLGNTTLNVVIVHERPAYWSLLLFNMLIIHSIWSAIMGLRRLRLYVDE